MIKENYRNIFPFQIGTTSYIVPYKKDNLIRNANYLKSHFDKIQLLYFGKDYLFEVMAPSIIDELDRIKKESDIEYSIHLPADFSLLNGHKGALTESIDTIMNIMDKTSRLKINEYVLHIDAVDNGLDTYQKEKSKDLFAQVLESLNKKLASSMEKIFIENLSYDLTFFSDIIFEYSCNICMDIGHIFNSNQNFFEFIGTFFSKINLVHLHGFQKGKDHISMSKIDTGILGDIFKFLESYKGSLIIEVFNQMDLIESMKILKDRIIYI